MHFSQAQNTPNLWSEGKERPDMLIMYIKAQNWWARVKDQKGQGMVEYGLIIALVAIGLIAVLGLMKGSVSNVFTKITTQMNTSSSAPLAP